MAFVTGEANPFGKTSIEQIQEFEGRIGFRLPVDYRRYLLSSNGAEPEDDVFVISERNQVRLDHWFGLHSGPEYLSLERNWKLYEWYDLQNWKRKLSKFLVFATTGTGDPFAIDLRGGAIWHYEHDVPPRWFGMPGMFHKVEDSFSAFITSLCSDEIADEQLKGTSEYETYQLILRAIELQKDK